MRTIEEIQAAKNSLCQTIQKLISDFVDENKCYPEIKIEIEEEKMGYNRIPKIVSSIKVEAVVKI